MDRKALIREYKESRRPMGVYRVHNTVNDKSFVGTSIDLSSMLNRQQAHLRMRRHPNPALQRDWKQLVADGYEEIFDTLTVPERTDYDPAQDLRALEELWLEKLSPFGDRGYNPSRSAPLAKIAEPERRSRLSHQGRSGEGARWHAARLTSQPFGVFFLE